MRTPLRLETPKNRFPRLTRLRSWLAPARSGKAFYTFGLPRWMQAPSAHIEHQLPAQMAAFAHGVRRGSLRQRIVLDLRRAHRTGSDERDDPLQMRAVAADVGTIGLHIVARRRRR